MALLQALVIDAHMPTRLYVKLLLALKGFDSFTASSEMAAKQYLDTFDVDLIIVAVDQPVSDMRPDAREPGHAPPVVFYTRRSLNGRTENHADARALSAPFAPRALYAAIERAFGEDADAPDLPVRAAIMKGCCRSRKIDMGEGAARRTQGETKQNNS